MKIFVLLILLIPNLSHAIEPLSVEERLDKAKLVAQVEFNRKLAELNTTVSGDPNWTITKWLDPTAAMLEYRGPKFQTKILVTQIGTNEQGRSIVLTAIIRMTSDGHGTFDSLGYDYPGITELR